MNTSVESVALPDLLQHAAWARRLAGELVRDDLADDLAQEALLVTSTRPVPPGAAPRKWLAAVMRNLARFGAAVHGQTGVEEEGAGPGGWRRSLVVLAGTPAPGLGAARLRPSRTLAVAAGAIVVTAGSPSLSLASMRIGRPVAGRTQSLQGNGDERRAARSC